MRSPARPFPGGIGAIHLRVYDSVAPDGMAGGTPHCHTACTEAYLVVGGSGGWRRCRRRLRGDTDPPGSFVWFTPGTIHRLLNDGGDLEIFVLMQNAGLPEAGDMVITFDDTVLADPVAYADAAALPHPTTAQGGDDPARVRRDRGVEGFTAIRAGGPDALGRFHTRAAGLVRPKIESWRATWEAGPVGAAEATRAQLDALAAGDATHLGRSSVHALPPPPDDRRWGCCGTLGTYVPAL